MRTPEQKSEIVHKHLDEHVSVVALYNSKSLSELKCLQLMAAKLEIKNERFKKDMGWEELAQTRNTLADKARI